MALTLALISAAFAFSPASALAVPTGLTPVRGSVGATSFSVTWHWVRDASRYRLQVSDGPEFRSVVATRDVGNISARPTGGRQALKITGLDDASYYWVRVRTFSGTHRSSWSPAIRVATKATWPDPITSVSMQPGPAAGETTISWRATGKNTDFFRIETALTPFSHTDPKVPQKGWDAHVFRAPGSARSLTLTPEQTDAAGAGLGTGRHLFYRIFAVRHGSAHVLRRGFAYLQYATIQGEGPTTTGTPIRVATYNVRLDTADTGTSHSWAVREPLVAANIAVNRPAVVAIQELMPRMWDNQPGALGLSTGLKLAGLGSYQLTRQTVYTDTTPIDARILYDTTKLQLVSNCPEDRPSCAITFPGDNGHDGGASYATFRDLASGQEFMFVSVHLSHGSTAAEDRVRGQQAQAVVAGIARINTDNLPVIFAGDTNSSQTSPGRDAPMQALLAAGYYDTSAAASQVNMQYNTVNAFAANEQPSNYGFGARLDAITTLGMPGASRFEIVRTGSPYPSDHNLVISDLRLPGA
jgi:endonuclease/exonuclease/phosphatase family metal-dependent hydrolase